MQDGTRHGGNPVDLKFALEERVKELNCLYGISEIVDHDRGSLEEVLQDIVNLLPSSWQYPDLACARIVLGDLTFETKNYAPTPWKQIARLRVDGKTSGLIEVSYLEERPERAEGPFLVQERRLLNAVAERTGHIIERLRAKQSYREREEELRGRLTHLTRVNTMGEMASSIAHEVNQPLTAIATYTQACVRLLKAGTAGTDEIVEILRQVTEEAIRAGGIIHRLKDMVRRRGGTRTVCDVNELIRDLEPLASVDARQHDVTLDLHLAPRLPKVLADGIQIQQVLLNLIRNGIDAMTDCDPAMRKVMVRSGMHDSGKLEINVTDSGCGLPPDCEEELFQPFFTTKKDGMGMGLSVSRSIVTSHGGQMWFSRNPGGGTTFFLTIPVITEKDDD